MSKQVKLLEALISKTKTTLLDLKNLKESVKEEDYYLTEALWRVYHLWTSDEYYAIKDYVESLQEPKRRKE